MELGTTNRRWLLTNRRRGNATPRQPRAAIDEAEVLLMYRDQLMAEVESVDEQLRALHLGRST